MVLYAYGPRKHRIQGEKSGLNIAMNSRGKVYATVCIKPLTTILILVIVKSNLVIGDNTKLI